MICRLCQYEVVHHTHNLFEVMFYSQYGVCGVEQQMVMYGVCREAMMAIDIRRSLMQMRVVVLRPQEHYSQIGT